MSNFQQRPIHVPPSTNVPTPGTISGVPLMPGMPVTMPPMPAFTPFARPPMPPNGLLTFSVFIYVLVDQQ